MKNRLSTLTIAPVLLAVVSSYAQPLPTRLMNEVLGGTQSSRSEESFIKLEELYDKGKYDEAIKTAERVLAIQEKETGVPAAEQVKLRLLLAGLYRAVSDFDKSEAAYKRALAIAESSLGPNHALLTSTLERYSCLMRRRNRTADADSLQERVLTILRPGPAGVKTEPIRGTLGPGRVIRLSQPRYPEQAKKMGVAGSVSVRILVDVSGKPITACTQDGPEVTALSAEDAALRSLWTPTTLANVPVRVYAKVVYNFVR